MKLIILSIIILIFLVNNLFSLEKFNNTNNLELYNLKNDISESNDLSKENIEKTLELYSELNMWRNKRNAPIPNRLNPDYDKKFVDSLLILIKNKKVRGRVFKKQKS